MLVTVVNVCYSDVPVFKLVIIIALTVGDGFLRHPDS